MDSENRIVTADYALFNRTGYLSTINDSFAYEIIESVNKNDQIYFRFKNTQYYWIGYVMMTN